MSETTYEKGRSPWIKNMRPGLPERGKIKIGAKGETRESSGGKKFHCEHSAKR